MRLDLDEVVAWRNKQRSSKLKDETITSSHWYKECLERIERKNNAIVVEDDESPKKATGAAKKTKKK